MWCQDLDESIFCYLKTDDALNIRRTSLTLYSRMCANKQRLWSLVQPNNKHMHFLKIQSLQFYIKAFKIYDASYVLKMACYYGHLKQVKWIINNYEVFNYEMNLGLLNASQGGHLSLMKWITRNFHIEKNVAIRAFLLSCKCSLNAAQWIKFHFTIIHSDIMNENIVLYFDKHLKLCGMIQNAFIESCNFGNLEVAKWLQSEYSLKYDCFYAKEAHRQSKLKNHAHITKWLETNFDIKPKSNSNTDLKFIIGFCIFVFVVFFLFF